MITIAHGFELVEILYRGSRTVVVRARRGDGSPAVLKLPAASTPYADARLRHEFEISRELESRYVARAVEIVAEPPPCALVFADLGASSLRNVLIDAERLDPGRVVEIAIDLATGLAALSAHGYALYGLFHLRRTDDPIAAGAFGRAALALSARFADPAVTAAVHFVVGMFLSHWCEPISASIHHLDAAHAAYLQAGNRATASFAAVHRATYRLLRGDPLDSLERGLDAVAGAQRAALAGEDDDTLVIEAEADVELRPDGAVHALPIDTAENLPCAIIRHVLARGEAYVSGTAQPVPDPYLARVGPQSALCLPVIHHGQAIAVLYLENRVTADVFPPERRELLAMLSTQAAISSHNARLYGSLERQVADRTRELARAKDAAVAATRAKSDFLAMMSHEIRTPMNAVIGMTSLVLGGELAREQREFVETIRSSGNAVLTLINDILVVSKVESGRMELDEQPFEIATTIGESVEIALAAARGKNLTIATSYTQDVPPAVRGDRTRLGQILVDLLGNAVKFTDEGMIALRIAAERLPAGATRLCFEVEDTGVGIPAEHLPRLFRPFRQGAASTARRYGGTGLGLAICKQLVEAMGGHISVESTPGRGSTFRFDITAKAVAATPAARGDGQNPTIATRPASIRPPAAAAQNEIYPLRVLLVEDHPVNQKLARLMLRRLGYAADLAGNGVEALGALQAAPYDVVLLDLHMPLMDGYETVRRIAERWSGPDKPFVAAMTADATEETRARCAAAGMDEFLTKPIQLDRLEALLRRRREAPRPGRPAGDENPSTGAASDEPASSDGLGPACSQLLEQLGVDEYEALMREFVADSEALMEEMRGAIAVADAGRLARTAHSLAGSSLTLGASSLATLARQMERLAQAGSLAHSGPVLAEMATELDRFGDAARSIAATTDRRTTHLPRLAGQPRSWVTPREPSSSTN